MVCSFLKEEGILQITNFLNKNKNFKISKFDQKKISFSTKFVDNNGFISTTPSELDNGILIDGFFAAKLIKYD